MYSNLSSWEEGETRILDPREWPSIEHRDIILADLSHTPERSTWKFIRQVGTTPLDLHNPSKPINDNSQLYIPEKYCFKNMKYLSLTISAWRAFQKM